MKKVYSFLLICLALTGSAQFHQMVITTKQGGAHGDGAIFTADSDGTNLHQVYSFQSATGRWPIGRISVDANGNAYGVTKFGGLGDSCVIYKYNLITNTYTLLHDFYADKDSGWWDQTGPLLLPDGKLYGVGEYGGANGTGALYRIDPATQHYEDLFDFDSTDGVSPTGLIRLNNGKLYGMSKAGIYSFDPSTNAHVLLHAWVDSTGSGGGYGTLIQGPDGKLYGTAGGGYLTSGVIFSLDITNNKYTCLHLFHPIYGAYPVNPLVYAPNGKLYGATAQGGILSKGTLFSFNLQDSTFTELHIFNDTAGAKPALGLSLASNGKLYGTTTEGGSHHAGLLFNYDMQSDVYSVVYEFDSVSGLAPTCMVAEVNLQQGTGVTEAQSSNFKFQIYPNPASSSVNIMVGEELIGSTITLTDVTGRQVNSVLLSIANLPTGQAGRELSTTSLSNGLYFLTIRKDGAVISQKLVIQRL